MFIIGMNIFFCEMLLMGFKMFKICIIFKLNPSDTQSIVKFKLGPCEYLRKAVVSKFVGPVGQSDISY